MQRNLIQSLLATPSLCVAVLRSREVRKGDEIAAEAVDDGAGFDLVDDLREVGFVGSGVGREHFVLGGAVGSDKVTFSRCLMRALSRIRSGSPIKAKVLGISEC